MRFTSSGTITGAYRILSNTRQNCAGGATPWNTWLSCEEVARGYVYETDPWGVNAAVRRDAMGRFKHEAAAADPVRQVIYLTEDETNGCFYRFIPTTWGNLSSGTPPGAGRRHRHLRLLHLGRTCPTRTARRPRPATRSPAPSSSTAARAATTRTTPSGSPPRATTASGSSTSPNSTYELAYDDSLVTGGAAPLTGVDNVTGSSSGDLFVAEDGGNMEICLITPDDVVAPFLRITGQSSSEITGPAFSPDGTRLYFSSQRGTSGSSSGGITYEVTGPFRA